MVSPQLIKERIVLSELISGTVKLKKSGAGWFGLCPFHKEDTPSFYVNDNTGRWRCWVGCGNGDVFDFLERTQGIDKKEAFRVAQGIAGIEDEFLTKSQKQEYEGRLRKQILEKKELARWRDGLVENLICYTNAEWSIFRAAKRQLMITWTEELEQQAEIAYDEAIKKEKALEELEEMKDAELAGWKATKRSWEGIRNPNWYLSGKRLQVALSAKKGAL